MPRAATFCFYVFGGPTCYKSSHYLTTKAPTPSKSITTKIQQHKQLITVRWGRQKSCPPCWDIQRLPGHCYLTTKGAGWDAQSKKWEQTEIRKGYEKDSGTACVLRCIPQLAGIFSWIGRSYVLSRHQLKRMNVSEDPNLSERFPCLENYCQGNYR